MLTLEQFKAEIRTGIILGDLNPINDVDLCGVIYSDKPETFWSVDISTMTVVECNINYLPKLMKIFKFGISWNDVLDQTGKTDINDLAPNEIIQAMLDIIVETDCVDEWYNELIA